jgi:hypothetical protein
MMWSRLELQRAQARSDSLNGCAPRKGDEDERCHLCREEPGLLVVGRGRSVFSLGGDERHSTSMRVMTGNILEVAGGPWLATKAPRQVESTRRNDEPILSF